MARGEQDRPVPWRDRLLLFSLLPLTWAVQAWTRSHPEFVENVYSRKIYPGIAEFVGTLTGWTSYSFAELLILLVVAITLVRKFRALRGLLQKRRSLKNVAAHGLSFSLAIVGILYFWGMFGWAFNYHRQPFLVSENLDRVGISAPELQQLSLSLASEANELRRHLEEDDDGLLRLLESKRDALKRGTVAFSTMEQEYETLRDGYVSRPKGPIFNLLPWLHIAEVVADAAAVAGRQRLAILGTRYLMEGQVYPPALAERGVDWLIPEPAERQRINEVIFDDLVYGRFEDTARQEFYEILARMQRAGCDAAVLGCTEIPLLVRADEAPLPVLDSTRLLARAALRAAVATGDQGTETGE